MGSVRSGSLNVGMPQNFIECDREQAFLLPPSLRDWLPEDHLAWFVLDAVARLDLETFFAAGGSSTNRCPNSIRARLQHVRRSPFSPSRSLIPRW